MADQLKYQYQYQYQYQHQYQHQHEYHHQYHHIGHDDDEYQELPLDLSCERSRSRSRSTSRSRSRSRRRSISLSVSRSGTRSRSRSRSISSASTLVIKRIAIGNSQDQDQDIELIDLGTSSSTSSFSSEDDEPKLMIIEPNPPLVLLPSTSTVALEYETENGTGHSADPRPHIIDTSSHGNINGRFYKINNDSHNSNYNTNYSPPVFLPHFRQKSCERIELYRNISMRSTEDTQDSNSRLDRDRTEIKEARTPNHKEGSQIPVLEQIREQIQHQSRIPNYNPIENRIESQNVIKNQMRSQIQNQIQIEVKNQIEKQIELTKRSQNQEDKSNPKPKTGQQECPCCHKFFKTPAVLRNHMLTHDKMYGFRFGCDQCQKRFAKIRKLEDHLAHKHNRPHLCAGCQMSFATQTEYNEHCQPLQIQIVIENGSNIATSAVANQVQCAICSEQFPNQCMLNKHLRIHDKINVLASASRKDKKDKKETNVTGLPVKKRRSRKNLRKEYTSAPYYNDDNDAAVANAIAKATASSRLTRQPSKNLSQNSNEDVPAAILPTDPNIGNDVETEPEPDQDPLSDTPSIFQCDFCDSAFNRAGILEEHLNSEHMGWKWLCRLCPQSFESKSLIKVHMQLSHMVASDVLSTGRFDSFASIQKQSQKRMATDHTEEHESFMAFKMKKNKIGRPRKKFDTHSVNDDVTGEGNNMNSNSSSSHLSLNLNSNSNSSSNSSINSISNGRPRPKNAFKCELCQPNKYYQKFSSLKCHYIRVHSDHVFDDRDLRSR